MKIKENKGFTGVDVAVSLVILLVFVSFVAALFYNLSNTSKRIERKSIATNLAIEVIESMKSADFTELDTYATASGCNTQLIELTDSTKTNFETLIGKTINIENGYEVKISIKNPEDKDGDASKSEAMGQVIKVISVQVNYTLGKSGTETVNIETLVKNIQ